MPKINKPFEPMKAYVQTPSDDWFEQQFARGRYFLVTDKFDGIRATNHVAGLFSRTMKPIPNEWICNVAKHSVALNFDMEIMTYTDGVPDDFHTIQSKVMTRDGQPIHRFHVFDDFTSPNESYHQRIERIERFKVMRNHDEHVEFELPRPVSSLYALKLEHEDAIARGREGLIVRHPEAPYKYGRSTLNEGWMLKLKLWESAEARIIGWEPLMRNTNEPTINVFGRQERGHGICGKVAEDMLGAFICESDEFGQFNVGGPFTTLQRCNFYGKHLNETLTYEFQRHGTKEKPRSPRFKGIRLD